ncbi:MAG: hypothetical protein ACM3X7_06310 [Solirubrobacterales bacterium]
MKNIVDSYLKDRADEAGVLRNNDSRYMLYERKKEELYEAIKKVLPPDKQRLLLDLIDYYCYAFVLSERIVYREGFFDGIKFYRELTNII